MSHANEEGPLATGRAAAQAALQVGLDRLPEQQRLLLSLRYLEGLGVAELAAAFALSPEQVSESLAEAMQSLSTLLASVADRKDLPGHGTARP